MRTRRWGDGAFYAVILGVAAFCVTTGVWGMGLWGETLGWALLAVWGAVTLAAMAIRVRRDRRRLPSQMER